MPKSTFSFNHIRIGFFLSVLILLSVGFSYLVFPFIYPIFWAAIIAVIFFPTYKKIQKYIQHNSISSFISILLIFALVFLPLIGIIFLTLNQSVTLYKSVSDGNLIFDIENVTNRLNTLPIIGDYIDTIKSEWPNYIEQATKSVTLFLYSSFVQFTQLSLRFVFMLFIMVYTLFYFLKDGEKFLTSLMYLSPLGDKHEQKIFKKFTSTIRATIKGTFIIGAIQGTLGGILFWATGIPGVIVWGVVMTALSVIPAIGSFIIWLPAGLVMIALGNIWQGLLILIFGSLVIGTIDNLLRPILVGKDIEMHPLIVLFSTLGGIIIFGISGFIIGPIIAALFLSFISLYDMYYKKDLKNN
jgi:predicted PurR-regulated permease PerM